MPDLSQRRASHAWTAIQRFKQVSNDPERRNEQKRDEGKYQTWAAKLPGLISQNGILPALAFLNAKKKEQPEVGQACWDWLKKPDGGASVIPWTQDSSDILERLQNEDSRVYRAAQAEALRWAVWLKRFAEGYLEGDEPSASATQSEGAGQS